MAPPSFNSSQTAVAIILPTHLQTEIDLIRSLNDKAYGRWQPHINILYPFVNLGLLPSARNTLGEAIRHNQLETFKIRIDDVGVFKHRKNATVYLKPSTESEDSLRRLRRILVSHLGGDDPGEHAQLEGTEYHPHLTIGQADLAGDAIEELSMKARKLVGVEWECKSLGLLRREPSGQMTLDFDLQLLHQKAGHDCSGLEHAESDREGDTSPAEHGWTSCFSFNPESGWSQPLKYTSAAGNGRADTSLTISSYNLMADPSAPQLSERFPLIMDALCSTKLSAESSLRILCLQEVNDETLTLLLSNSDIQATYPYSTHSPSSVFPSHRNLLTLASVPFKQFTIAFPQRHKTALVIQPVNSTVSVINVHLTSALTDEAIISKQVQMTQLTNFITRDKALGGREVFVVGDFNVTTSCRTLEAALDKGIISHETAQSVESVIDMDFWGDAYIESGHHLEESRDDLHPGEEGATFDRSSNPLAAMSKTVIDTSPQRYDRILFRKGAQIDVKLFERFGFPTSTGQCGSDHFGIHARLALGRPQVSAFDVKSMTTATSEFQLNKIELIEDATDVSCLIEPYLPSPEDRNQRTAALDIIHKALVTDDALADLVIAPLGSYAMDTYLANSDLDLLAIGSVAPRQFFESAISRMRALANADSNNDGFKSVQIVNSLVQIIDVIVAGVKVDLQYCQAAELLQRQVQYTSQREISYTVRLIPNQISFFKSGP
jgi:2'-5' RNA ligase/endonuclease/exonuclease/phosphatase family metal-dependent hydrolase